MSEQESYLATRRERCYDSCYKARAKAEAEAASLREAARILLREMEIEFGPLADRLADHPDPCDRAEAALAAALTPTQQEEPDAR